MSIKICIVWIVSVKICQNCHLQTIELCIFSVAKVPKFIPENGLCLIDLLHFPQLKYFNGKIYLHFLTLQNFKVPKFNRPPALSPLLYSLCYISPFLRAQLDISFGKKRKLFPTYFKLIVSNLETPCKPLLAFH